MVRVERLEGRIKRLEKANDEVFLTTIQFEDGTEETLNYLDIFDMVFRLNGMPFRSPEERELTGKDWEWIAKMKHAIPNPRDIAYALVVNAREITREYTACQGIPLRRKYCEAGVNEQCL